MPGLNRTGPLGLGPRTGRGRGVCGRVSEAAPEENGPAGIPEDFPRMGGRWGNGGQRRGFAGGGGRRRARWGRGNGGRWDTR